MKMMVVGCGRMGAELAQLLLQRGHTVTVIDSDSQAFARLKPHAKLKTVTGIAFDRDTLMKADIEHTDALAAVTSSDEANVVTARLASQIFFVPRVVARVYDPRKAEIYRRLGLQTISPLHWGIQRTAELLCYSELDAVLSLGAGEVEIIEAYAPHLLAGRTVREVTAPNEVQVTAITRGGRTFIPTLGTEFQEGDLLHLAVLTTATERLKNLLALA
jgi:trk system potassium uptake protein TrkA